MKRQSAGVRVGERHFAEDDVDPAADLRGEGLGFEFPVSARKGGSQTRCSSVHVLCRLCCFRREEVLAVD
jgi:hypothetical protein